MIVASHTSAIYLAGHSASARAVRDAEEQVLATWSALVQRGTHANRQDVPGTRPDCDPECFYFDAHHLTTTCSRSLAPYLGAAVSAVLGRAS